MAITQPPQVVKDIAPWVLGSEWPDGDEDAMLRLAEVWEATAKDVDAAMRAADSAVKQARESFDGPSARQFDELWAKFVHGDEAAFTRLKDGSEQLAKACRACALQIEHAKLSIMAALSAMAIQVIAMVTAAFATSGGSLAGIMPAQLATRQVVVTIFRDLVQRLGEQVGRTLPHRMSFSVAAGAAIDDAGRLLRMANGTREAVGADPAPTAVRGAFSGNFSLESIAGMGADLGAPDVSAVTRTTSGGPLGITPSPGPRDNAAAAVSRPAAGPRPRDAFPESGPQRFSGNLDMSPPVQAAPQGPVALRGQLVPTHLTHFVVDGPDTADSIRASGWDGEQPVLLAGYPAGSTADVAAAQLSRELGGEVTVPDRDAWTDVRGNLFASSSLLGPKDLRPCWPPNGEWTTVKPDGTGSPHDQSSPLGHVPDWRAARLDRRGEAPGSANGPTTSPPSMAERPQVHRQLHESDASAGAGDTRSPKLIAPEGAPLFFANRPDFRASAADVHHMRQSYGLDAWYRDAAGIDDAIAQNPYLRDVPRDQLIALRGLTAPPAFKVINDALRTNDIQTLRRYEGYIKVVNSALNQLPPLPGLVHRVVNTDHPLLRANQYRYDAVVTERAFLSGSAGGPSRAPGKVMLQIHSLTGRDVSALSHRPHEREVLFPSGTRFKVIGTGFDPRTGTHHAQLREIPAAQAPGASTVRTGETLFSGPQSVHSGRTRPQARRQSPVRQQDSQAVPNRAQATTPLHRPQSPAHRPVRQETHIVPVTQPLRKREFDLTAHRPTGAPPRNAETAADPAYKAPPPDFKKVKLDSFDGGERLPDIVGTRAGIAIFGKGDDHETGTARSVEPIPGHFVVDTHGRPDALLTGGTALTGEVVVNILDALPHSVWDRRTPIIFTGCGTGQDPNGIAAHVARHFGVETTAPRTDTWVDDNGTIFAAESVLEVSPTGYPRSERPSNGDWTRFTPDGNHHISRHPYLPDRGHETPKPSEKPDNTSPELTPGEVRTYLDRPEVVAALAAVDSVVGTEDENGTKIQLPVAEVIRERLPNHPELVDLMQRTGYLEPFQPLVIASFLRHPTAIEPLIEAVHEVDTLDPDEVAQPGAREGAPTPVELTAEQRAIAETAANGSRAVRSKHRVQTAMKPGETISAYLDARYADAAIAHRKLTELVNDLADRFDGYAVPRTALKNRADAEKYTDPGGKYEDDPTRLVDIASACIQFNRLDDVYRALDHINRDDDIRIVDFNDRFTQPQKSGYGDVRMSVQFQPDNHVSELRLHLVAVDDVAEFEHEVRRNAEPQGKALMDAFTTRQRQLFRDALKPGEAGE
ncbi:hypothetical protein [Kibdelosporangium phytohabitans]|uniref:Uncharacterized protein n=1 Tax=Kibdelosporangium phytohabitans TaxID=860235 RepID=A0A0N9I1S9_9PSEU|nr:hypothetical protein [Kibdelosporangium phytohabitans]ALG13902.1 hypothetical protein AOZ06_49815 [Kibdelosporangium phytohabitans]MBE1467162.1 hypothetical protein [Kibdelosporangium phytohabitans]